MNGDEKADRILPVLGIRRVFDSKSVKENRFRSQESAQ
jgi:hypothetical protein